MPVVRGRSTRGYRSFGFHNKISDLKLQVMCNKRRGESIFLCKERKGQLTGKEKEVIFIFFRQSLGEFGMLAMTSSAWKNSYQMMTVSLNNKRGERINEGMQLISNKI